MMIFSGLCSSPGYGLQGFRSVLVKCWIKRENVGWINLNGEASFSGRRGRDENGEGW